MDSTQTNLTSSPLAFAAPALQLASRTSSLFPSATSLRRSTAAVPLAARRAPARRSIVALGAAPPPPPPNGSSEEEGGSADSVPDAGADISADAAASEGAAAAGGDAEVTADDILNSPSFLKKKLEIVQKELLELKKKAGDVETDDGDESSAGDGGDDGAALKEEKARYVRLAADFENYRRRTSDDLRQQDAKSTARVCKEIVGVLDNFERATAAVDPQTDKEGAIVGSYNAIYKELVDALGKLGVEPVDAVGQLFDPEVHEAIQRADSDDFHEDVVCNQFQRGYKIGDLLVRPAVVAVSSGPGPEGVPPPTAADAEVVDEQAEAEAVDTEAETTTEGADASGDKPEAA